MKLTYYRDLQAYGDGTHLYVSPTGVAKSWGASAGDRAYCLSRLAPDLVVDCWSGAAAGPVKLYRRDRVRARLGEPVTMWWREMVRDLRRRNRASA